MRADLFALHADVELKHWWFAGRRDIVRAIVTRALHGLSRPVVVDVGCGTGANLGLLPDDYVRIGIDPSEEAIALARTRFRGVQFIHGNAPAGLGDVARRADMVMLLDVLEHVENDYALLSEVVAAAKPGCRILITVPAHPDLWSEHDVSFGHFRRYSPERFRALWKQLDVSEELCAFFNARLYPLVRVARIVSRLRGRAYSSTGTDLVMPPALLNGILRALFSGERTRLLNAWGHPEARAYRTGVSMIAVLMREGAAVEGPRAMGGSREGSQRLTGT